VGVFFAAALDQFPDTTRALGIEINPEHVRQARSAIRVHRQEIADKNSKRVQIRRGDFFQTDWTKILGELPEPILVIGNPPWVTNSELGSMDSGNLPVKSNFQQHRGLDARTGRSNFDLSEYMLLHLIERLEGRQATLAMLCKTAVARRVLAHAWKMEWKLERSEVRRINAGAHFGAAVDACLLVCDFFGSTRSMECEVFPELHTAMSSGIIGWRDGCLVADVGAYQRTKHLLAERPGSFWRSGIKHDCAAIMELRREGRRYRNGLGEVVDLERDCVFPMLKSSEMTEQRCGTSNRYMVVPQRSVSDDTRLLARTAPKTWRYLESHADLLSRSPSSVYEIVIPIRSLWRIRVAVESGGRGLSKLRFVAVGPHAANRSSSTTPPISCRAMAVDARESPRC
jgi:hypothetical protein